MYRAALAAGAYDAAQGELANATLLSQQADLDADREKDHAAEVLEATIAAVKDILAEGDASLLTEQNEPKMSVLKANVPEATPELRAQALSVIADEQTESGLDIAEGE